MDHAPNTIYTGSTRHRSCENMCIRHLDVQVDHARSAIRCPGHFVHHGKVFSEKTVPEKLSDCCCLFRRKHTRAVIPNAQTSPGRVMAYWSDSTFSGASQFHEPPQGRSTVMLNEELARCEWPKSVRSARPSSEISTFIC